MWQTTIRKARMFLDVIPELENRPLSLQFRILLAGLIPELQRAVAVWATPQKYIPGLSQYQEEFQVLQSHCMEEREGRRFLNLTKFQPLYGELLSKYANIWEEVDRRKQQAENDCDKLISVNVNPIPMEVLLSEDQQQVFNAEILSVLLTFTKEKEEID